MTRLVSRGRRQRGAAILLLAWLAVSVQSGCAQPGPPTPAERDAAAASALNGADLALARNELDVAERGYLLALETWPEDPRVLTGLTRVALAREDLEAALAWDDSARALTESAPRSLNGRERCALWQAVAESRIEADVDSAAEIVARMDEDASCDDQGASPLRARIHAARAARAQARGETDLAIAESRAAIEADPSRADIDLQAVNWLLDAGREREALTWLSTALERHPADQALLLLMLEVLGVPGAAEQG